MTFLQGWYKDFGIRFLYAVQSLDSLSLGACLACKLQSVQLIAECTCFHMIIESYKANVPEAQQSGITIRSLSDNEVEHEYWLKGDVPNLFDAKDLRKWAYKGACDGIAGKDLGLKFGGDDYKAYYEKNNVSSTIK